jgi:hypothetical protein
MLTMLRGFSALLFTSLLVFAYSCGSAGAEDPRCQALCEPAGRVPSSGLGTYCDEQSVALCKDSCGARISGLVSLCASCVLEKASFQETPRSSNGPSCNTMAMTCTETNYETGESCTYPSNDEAQRKACQQKLYAARAVSCSAPTYRPVTDCASVCTGTK